MKKDDVIDLLIALLVYIPQVMLTFWAFTTIAGHWGIMEDVSFKVYWGISILFGMLAGNININRNARFQELDEPTERNYISQLKKAALKVMMVVFSWATLHVFTYFGIIN